MESDRTVSSAVVEDDAFRQLERKLLLNYASGFDAWLMRAIADKERNAAAKNYAERLERALTIDTGIVYDLARLC